MSNNARNPFDELADAIRRDDLIGITAALEAGADPNATDDTDDRPAAWSALAEAAYQDAVGDHSPRFVEILLAAGADPNPPGYPPLFMCINQLGTSLPAMHRLLDAGADPNAINPADGDTLVHRVTQIGSNDAIELVLGLGLSLERGDACGRTPLLAAVHQENPDAIRRLLQAGADPTAVDSDGLSAEQLAQDSERTDELLAALCMS
jgi:ankyrin repeat protein